MCVCVCVVLIVQPFHSTVERGVVLPGGVGGPGALWGEDLPWGVFVMNALKARLTYRKDIDYILEVRGALIDGVSC